MSANKKTVLSLVNLAPKKFGSFELILIVLSKRLQDKNYESVIIFNKDIPVELKNKYKGTIVDSLTGSRGPVYFYYQLTRLLLKYKPDIVHLGFYPMFSPMILLIYLCGCHNILFTDHISGKNSKHKGIKACLLFLRNKFIGQFIKKYICVSNYVLERDKSIPAIDPAKLTLLYFGVCFERFRPYPDISAIRQELNIRQGDFVICTVANLINEKGIDHLIKAAKIITDRRNNVLFLIVGEGKDENKLKTLTKDLNLENKVKFLGLRNDSERIFSASDIFVCPSVWQEAFGLTNIEAMACGLPVIATKVGGIPEIVENGVTGILIEAKDPQAIANSIDQLYIDPDLCKKMGQRSLKRVKDRFNLDRTINETIAIYESCI